MSKHNIFEFKDRDTILDELTEILRMGSQQLIHQAVQIELEELLAATETAKFSIASSKSSPHIGTNS